LANLCSISKRFIAGLAYLAAESGRHSSSVNNVYSFSLVGAIYKVCVGKPTIRDRERKTWLILSHATAEAETEECRLNSFYIIPFESNFNSNQSLRRCQT